MTTKQRIRYYLYLCAVYPLALLPLPVLYAISDFLYFILYKILKYRKKVVRKNLIESFPDMTPAQIRETERDFYHQLCDNIVETIKLLHISQRTLADRIRITNGDLVRRIADSGKPIVLFLGHYGNWEWMPAMTMSYPRDIYSAHIYKKMHDAAADALMTKVRKRFPSEGLEIMRSVRDILRLARDHKRLMVGFISDHRFNSVPRHQSTRFLNHDTPYYIGGEAIGNKIGAAYLYLDVERTGRGRYRLTFVEVTPDDNDPNPITRKYYRLLEKTIMRRPGLWLWSHKRWK